MAKKMEDGGTGRRRRRCRRYRKSHAPGRSPPFVRVKEPDLDISVVEMMCRSMQSVHEMRDSQGPIDAFRREKVSETGPAKECVACDVTH